MNTGNQKATPSLTTIAVAAVASSQISAYGYDAASQTLQVDFKDNPEKVYQYPGVSAETFAELEAAESKGGFLHRFKKTAAFTRFNRATGEFEKEWTPPKAEETEGAGAQEAA